MTTVEEIVKDIKSFSPSHISGVAIAKWLNNRYLELCSEIRFRHLMEVGELALEEVVDDGTIAITQGSTSVTGDSTTWATSPGVGTDKTDYFLKTSSTWYRIDSIASDTALTLATAWQETSVSDESYQIVRRYYSLASTARWLGMFVIPKYKKEIMRVSPIELDMSHPGRILISGYPSTFSFVGVDSDGYLQVEFYPCPISKLLVRYTYWPIPTDLTLPDDIPAQIDHYVLKEGVLIDVYRAAKMQALISGSIDAANSYGNEESKQRTLWRKIKNDAFRTANAVNDKSLILRDLTKMIRTDDVMNGRDYTLLEGSGL